jgi:zeta-carotene desaturase
MMPMLPPARAQVLRLFPSAAGLGEPSWHSIVKIGQSLYREAPGMDPFRPDQATPVRRMFLAGSYTKQDYIDSMCAPPCALRAPVPFSPLSG